MKWIVVGISGPTNSGKTSLSEKLLEIFENSLLIKQDNYFLAVNDPRHILVPELNHFNWEIMSSLDMKKMHTDILNIIGPSKNKTQNESKVRILFIEGFLIFNCKAIADLCDLKYFLLITKEECWNRRKDRAYDPPDVPGYFEKIVWPEYLRHKTEIMADAELCKTITFLDGTQSIEASCDIISKDITHCKY